MIQIMYDHDSYYYRCERCRYETKVKCHLINHLNKQKVCPPMFSKEARDVLIARVKVERKPKAPKPKEQNICILCSKNYSCRWNLMRHMETCKAKFQNESVEKATKPLLETVHALQEQIEQMKLHNSTLVNKPKYRISHIRYLGDENVQFILDRKDYEQFMMHVISSPDGFIDFIKYQNMNPEHPENHNIKRESETIVDEDDTILIVDSRGDVKTMKMMQWVAGYAFSSCKLVFEFVSKLQNRAKQISNSENDIHSMIVKFYHNFALPLNYDIGIKCNVDHDYVREKSRDMCIKLLSCMPVSKGQKRT